VTVFDAQEEPMTDDGFTTCLWFDGRAEDAARYYVSVFKNSGLGRIVRNNDAGHAPAGTVLTVEFTANGQKFLALNGGPEFRFTEAVSFQIMCEDQEEVDHYWDELTADGGEEGPCGWLKDRFGLSWQVVPRELLDLVADPDQERAARATRVMYTMHRLDLAALKRAHAGE
jgi:predicted 3-demethylubiquinone-9 3-methyltransferase (glyoxalase superfamily)